MSFTLESMVKASLVLSLVIATFSPVLLATLPAATANELNITAYNQTNALSTLVFQQVNNTVFCGNAGSCNPTTSTGGFYAQANLFSAFAFVLNGFGVLMTALINTPYILSTWTGELFSIIGYPITTAGLINGELTGFMAFIIAIIGVSALMKFPLRSA